MLTSHCTFCGKSLVTGSYVTQGGLPFCSQPHRYFYFSFKKEEEEAQAQTQSPPQEGEGDLGADFLHKDFHFT